MASTQRAPKTMPSSSEFEASRFAPCTPVQAASPAAQRPGSAVAPSRSVSTPPRQVVGGRRDRQPVPAGIEPGLGRATWIVGKRRGEVLERGRVEPHVLAAVFAQLAGDRPAHDVARQQLVDETLARAGRAGPPP